MHPKLRLITSAGLLAGLCCVALGQQPTPPPKAAEPKKAAEPDVIALALANDPDVQIAQAKASLAQAELLKARQAVVLRITQMQNQIRQLEGESAATAEQYSYVNSMHQKGVATSAELRTAQAVHQKATAMLEQAQMELKLITGQVPEANYTQAADLIELTRRGGGTATPLLPEKEAEAIAQLHKLEQEREQTALNEKVAAMKGPVSDRLRKALDKPATLPDGNISLKEALQVFKERDGLDVIVRCEQIDTSIESNGQELPMGAWLHLYEDAGEFQFYVRPYGLLGTINEGPPSAPTLQQFWKMSAMSPKVPDEGAAKEKK
jgi:hypothetical protein